jgi:hypothetical protein
LFCLGSSVCLWVFYISSSIFLFHGFLLLNFLSALWLLSQVLSSFVTNYMTLTLKNNEDTLHFNVFPYICWNKKAYLIYLLTEFTNF